MQEIASGWSHSCGLSGGGQASCWGNGGALGADALKYSTTALVVGSELQLHSIAVGDGFSCALAPDHTAVCWGANRDGQLGTPGVDRSNEPLAVAASRSTPSPPALDARAHAGGPQLLGRECVGPAG
jgi:alpha-tubulin suppressor-like RCC1 family protein